MADEAHNRGLAVDLKNAPDMVVGSLSFFEFAITEVAFSDSWVNEMLPFLRVGKPIFTAEYTDVDVNFDAVCTWSYWHNVSFILKNRILTAFRVNCP